MLINLSVWLIYQGFLHNIFNFGSIVYKQVYQQRAKQACAAGP